jgi:hypothetical protein
MPPILIREYWIFDLCSCSDYIRLAQSFDIYNIGRTRTHTACTLVAMPRYIGIIMALRHVQSDTQVEASIYICRSGHLSSNRQWTDRIIYILNFVVSRCIYVCTHGLQKWTCAVQHKSQWPTSTPKLKANHHRTCACLLIWRRAMIFQLILGL